MLLQMEAIAAICNLDNSIAFMVLCFYILEPGMKGIAEGWNTGLSDSFFSLILTGSPCLLI